MKKRRNPLTHIRSHLPPWLHFQQILTPKKLPEDFPPGRAESQTAFGGDFLLCHSNKGDFLVSISICHTWKFQFHRKTWISSSKWNHFKTWPRIRARTEMHVTGLGGTAKKSDKNSKFWLIVFSFHQQVSAQIFQVVSEVQFQLTQTLPAPIRGWISRDCSCLATDQALENCPQD